MWALGVVVVLACAAFAAVALATSHSSRPPSVTLSAPREVVGGTGFVVAGKVSAVTSGQVIVQVEVGARWKTVGHARVRGRHFKASVVLTGEGPVNLRATLAAASSPPVRSAARRVLIRPAPSLPPAPVATAPPTATTQVAPALPPEPPAEPSAVPDYYWGAWVDGNPSLEDVSARERFERSAGKPLSILEAYSPWAKCSSGNACPPNQAFPAALFEKVRAYGAIPMYSWASEANGSPEEPEYQLADILSGKYDGYIEQWAKEAKAWGHPFFLRFDWEMNGSFFPWGANVNGNKEGEYVSAWQHVHDIFARVGVTNATWLWCPFANPGGNLPATTGFYPGDAYVDWTGIDGYNRGDTSPGSHWRTFSQVFGADYAAITSLAPSKPMLLPEVASAETGGPEGGLSKATWIRQMFAELPTAFPDIRGFLWFDHDENDPQTGMPHGWPIESSAAATEAFAAGIADPRYLSKSLGALPDGPVPVPPG